MTNGASHNREIEELLSDPNPLWLWDGISGRIYWANEAGLEFWHASSLENLQEMQFDHAMPALRRLRKLTLGDVPDQGRDEKLLFWTLEGNRHVICNCVKIHVDGYGELLLLRLRVDQPASPHVIAPNADPANPAQEPEFIESATEHFSSGKLLDGDDVAATLREIARQVRAESKFSGPDLGSANQPSNDRNDGQGMVRKPRGEGPVPNNDKVKDAAKETETATDIDAGTDTNNAPNAGEAESPLSKIKSESIDDVEFLAKISHEVRTPLNSILGFSELMMQERLGAVGNAKYAEYITDIHESAVLALSLINDVLDLSRISAGQFDVSAEEFDLNSLANSMVRIMRPQAEKNRVTLKLELASHEIMINAGQRSIKQVLLNLLTNAIKFTGSGGSVTVATGLKNDNWVYVKIGDTGSGMTETELKTVMQPFNQLERNAKHIEGTGLGLPITKALVDANGGQFVIESKPDLGTEVTVLFPKLI